MIVIIDNYDSFTYNIYQSISRITPEAVCVMRSKECTLEDIEKQNPSHLILSPGPGRPENAGITEDAVRHFRSLPRASGHLPRLRSKNRLRQIHQARHRRRNELGRARAFPPYRQARNVYALPQPCRRRRIPPVGI